MSSVVSIQWHMNLFILQTNISVNERSTKTMCRCLSNPQLIQILGFDVEGLKTTLNDPSFLELVQGG